MDQDLAMALRERAVSALQASTTMLDVAENLLQQGNDKEAARLRNEARYKRNESVLLMDQARAVEERAVEERPANLLKFPDWKNSLTGSRSASDQQHRRTG